MASTVVVGLDGGSFELIDPWLADGTCPTLSSLRDGGRWSSLRSSLPPVTCPAWRCYSTGVNPGKHGVFWWEKIDRTKRDFGIPTSESFAAPDLWDYLGDAGLESGIINMPTTFPPETLHGYMISGGGGVDGKEYTYPSELKEEIESQFDYRAFIEAATTDIGADPNLVNEVLELIDTRFEAAQYIRDEYDPEFLQITVFYTNVFHHFFWDDESTRLIWKRVDENMDRFLRDDDNVVVISDHGTNRIDYTFNINVWLEANGYLVTESTVSDRLYDANFTRENVSKLASRLGLKNTLKRYVPRKLIDTLPRSDGSVAGTGKASKIDWESSSVMASGQGPVYVLEEDPAERAVIVEQLLQELETVKTPGGKRVARAVHRGKDIYEGPYVDEGPDIVLEQADHVYISGALGLDDTFQSPNGWVAENHRDGLFIANGPDVSAEGELSKTPTIYDVAPTLLHWHDVPVPEYLDGTVVNEVFDPTTGPGSRSVERVSRSLDETEGNGDGADQKQMRERLQDLGYLSE